MLSNAPSQERGAVGSSRDAASGSAGGRNDTEQNAFRSQRQQQQQVSISAAEAPKMLPSPGSNSGKKKKMKDRREFSPPLIIKEESASEKSKVKRKGDKKEPPSKPKAIASETLIDLREEEEERGKGDHGQVKKEEEIESQNQQVTNKHEEIQQEHSVIQHQHEDPIVDVVPKEQVPASESSVVALPLTQSQQLLHLTKNRARGILKRAPSRRHFSKVPTVAPNALLLIEQQQQQQPEPLTKGLLIPPGLSPSDLGATTAAGDSVVAAAGAAALSSSAKGRGRGGMVPLFDPSAVKLRKTRH